MDEIKQGGAQSAATPTLKKGEFHKKFVPAIVMRSTAKDLQKAHDNETLDDVELRVVILRQAERLRQQAKLAEQRERWLKDEIKELKAALSKDEKRQTPSA